MRTTPIRQLRKTNRPEKGGSFRREGKKEGVGGRNFCLPALLSFGFARCSFTRRPRFAGGRRGQERQDFAKFSWRLASMFLFEIGSNFFIKAAPNEKSWFLRRGRPRFLQLASHLKKPLIKKPEVAFASLGFFE